MRLVLHRLLGDVQVTCLPSIWGYAAFGVCLTWYIGFAWFSTCAVLSCAAFRKRGAAFLLRPVLTLPTALLGPRQWGRRLLANQRAAQRGRRLLANQRAAQRESPAPEFLFLIWINKILGFLTFISYVFLLTSYLNEYYFFRISIFTI